LEDDRVRQLFLRCAAETMREAETATPGQSLIYVQVPHYTSRNSDPHLHVHGGIVNLTFNSDKERWGCLQPNFLYWPRHQMTENHRVDLANGLTELGYEIADKPKQGFEIEGISKDLMERFSTRSKEITNEERVSDGILSQRLAAVGTRKDKREEPKTYGEYLEFQREKMTPGERNNLRNTVEKAYEHSHRIHLRVAQGEESSEAHHLTYGERIRL
jgi:conjugative relaxase-like TrwC/TraI family protein